MDGNRKGGWRVCVNTADFIRSMVHEELKGKGVGHLSGALVALLRKEAKEDAHLHRTIGYGNQFGGGPAAKPKR